MSALQPCYITPVYRSETISDLIMNHLKSSMLFLNILIIKNKFENILLPLCNTISLATSSTARFLNQQCLNFYKRMETSKPVARDFSNQLESKLLKLRNSLSFQMAFTWLPLTSPQRDGLSSNQVFQAHLAFLR